MLHPKFKKKKKKICQRIFIFAPYPISPKKDAGNFESETHFCFEHLASELHV